MVRLAAGQGWDSGTCYRGGNLGLLQNGVAVCVWALSSAHGLSRTLFEIELCAALSSAAYPWHDLRDMAAQHGEAVASRKHFPTPQCKLAGHPTYSLLGFSAALAPEFPPGGPIGV